MAPLASTLSYTATCSEKPRWSLRPRLWAVCKQTSRDVEAESTRTGRLSPVAKMTWTGMCFFDLTAWGQRETQAFCPDGPGLSRLPLSFQNLDPRGQPTPQLSLNKVLDHRCWLWR